MLDRLFDTHAHYNNPRFDDDRTELLANLPRLGISYVLNASYDMESSRASVSLSQTYGYIYAAVGIHPQDAEQLTQAALNELALLAAGSKVVAIGETGLDYYRDTCPRDLQKAAFNAQLALAVKLNLPIIVHDREAHDDCMDIIKKHPGARCVFHCYSGSADMARQLIDMGHLISFTCNVTYPKSEAAREAALAVGLSKIMIETDCPYLAPQPLRGKRCDSSMLSHAAECLAQWFNVTPDEIAEKTTATARAFFNITPALK